MIHETKFEGNRRDCITLQCIKCIDERRAVLERCTSLWVTPAGALLLWCEIHEVQVAHIPNDKLSESFMMAIKMGCEHCSCGLPHGETH